MGSVSGGRDGPRGGAGGRGAVPPTPGRSAGEFGGGFAEAVGGSAAGVTGVAGVVAEGRQLGLALPWAVVTYRPEMALR